MTATLSVSPSNVTTGTSATLTWSTSNATTVSINNGIGTVGASGSMNVNPTATTTYTLTATGNGQTVTSTATLTIAAPTPAPTAQLMVAPASIPSGQSATLSWSTTNATSVSINNGIGTVAASGSMSVSPTSTTTYTLTATGNGQTVTSTATVTVIAPAPAPTAQLVVSPASIPSGQSATLTWNTSDATSVSINNGIGTVGSSGSMSVSPTATTTYTLTATGGGQTVTSTATLTITAPAPTAQLTASPTSISSGQSATLTWSTSNATTISINNGIGTVASSGSTSVSPTATTTYTLTTTGGGQTVTSTATVTVTAPALTAQLTASPTSISSGQSATLTWSTSNATSVSISSGIGTVGSSGSMSVSPTATTTYTLTATGNGQTVTSTAIVTVGVLASTTQLTASPATIQVLSGQSSTLTWSTSNATSISIDNGIGTVTPSGTQTVSPSQTTTYTLTAVVSGQTEISTATVTVTPLTGVLEWKGDATGDGLYGQETTLTPANVNVTQFGKVISLGTDGILEAQPLYVRNVDLGASGVHNLLIAATENDSVYAFDGQGSSATPLWRRSFLSPTSCTTDCITTQPDDHGGRSTFGGQVGITGAPVIDPQTGIMYLVAATEQNSIITDTLHAIDIRTGDDAGIGSVVISASVPGSGEDSVDGQIPFNADYENQRPGLVLSNGVLYVAYGSFSDVPPYHGWLFAYDSSTLAAIFNSTPNYIAANPDYEEGIGAGFWNGAASPAFASDGTFYIIAANGSTDVEDGGTDYGDTVLHLSFENGQFEVLDWFTPSDRDCIDRADLEIGSGGVTLLPSEVGGSSPLAVTASKEGRLYLLDQDNLGQFNATTDQVVQEFMVGADTCTASTTAAGAADGTTWNRLYGDVSYWNGNLYMAAANAAIDQYSIADGVINPVPVAVGATETGVRGGNTVVSSNGNSDGIVWMYEKTASGDATLHAYNATNVGTELWNSQMNATRDALTTGASFEVPVVVDGEVIAASGGHVSIYSILP